MSTYIMAEDVRTGDVIAVDDQKRAWRADAFDTRQRAVGLAVRDIAKGEHVALGRVDTSADIVFGWSVQP